jgi:hypothetical protein
MILQERQFVTKLYAKVISELLRCKIQKPNYYPHLSRTTDRLSWLDYHLEGLWIETQTQLY